MTLTNVGEAYWFCDMISDSVYYRIFQVSRHTRVSVCIFEGEEGRASDWDLPSLLMPGVYSVRCASYYEITLMPATLCSHWSVVTTPGPDWRDQGRDGEGGTWFTLKWFRVFGNPSPASPDKAVEHCKIPWEIQWILHNTRHKLCPQSVQSCCTPPGTLTPFTESHAHLSAATWIVKNIHTQQMCKLLAHLQYRLSQLGLSGPAGKALRLWQNLKYPTPLLSCMQLHN